MRAGAEEQGVVIGRVHGELILIKTDRGVTRSLRVRPEVGAKLHLGQRASVSLDAAGRPSAVVAIGS